MFKTSYARWSALLQRELREYRLSLVWTPLVIACVLSVIMLTGIVVANKFSTLGETIMEAVIVEQSDNAFEIRIGAGESDRTAAGDNSLSGAASEDYRVRDVPGQASDDWDFARDWRQLETAPPGQEPREGEDEIKNLNPLLNSIHSMLMLILILVTVHYLLGCLYVDRKDRSILFWKSMPVSARDEVITKLGVALLVAPAIFIAASLLAQAAMMVLAMLLASRAGLDATSLVLGNIDFGALLWGQMAGWIVAALWLAPVYAWLMLASAAARRSPFLVAVTPVIALLVLEAIILGSNHVGLTLLKHIPHYLNEAGASAPLHPFGSSGTSSDYLALLLGLLGALGLLWLAVWLRRHRWEL